MCESCQGPAEDESQDLPGIDADALQDVWQEWTAPSGAGWGYLLRRAFREHLESMFTIHCDIVWCESCDEPKMDDDTVTDRAGCVYCQPCADEMYSCDRCDSLVSSTESVSGESWCESCRDGYAAYCDQCEEYYDNDNDESHDHSCECGTFHETFTMMGGYANDTRFTVASPEGEISLAGLIRIRKVVNNWTVPDPFGNPNEMRPVYIGSTWLADTVGISTKEGSYAKRVRKAIYKAWQVSLPDDIVTEIGNIANSCASKSGEGMDLEITRHLNMGPEAFAHEGSCWWGEYHESRCALKSNGGFGLRSFDDSPWGEPTGRAWVMPVRVSEAGRVSPTFDALTPDAFLVFNGYHDLPASTAANLVAQMTGWTFRKIVLGIAPMYLNDGVGYIVGTEDVITRASGTYNDISLDLNAHSSLPYSEVSQERVSA